MTQANREILNPELSLPTESLGDRSIPARLDVDAGSRLALLSAGVARPRSLARRRRRRRGSPVPNALSHHNTRSFPVYRESREYIRIKTPAEVTTLAGSETLRRHSSFNRLLIRPFYRDFFFFIYCTRGSRHRGQPINDNATSPELTKVRK